MSSTITCKRVACAFRDANGQTIYVLGEVGYESNVYPHTRRLSVVSVGDLKQTIRSIFNFASYVEGGGLTSPSRKLTPESYLRSWMLALRKPHAIDPHLPLSLDSVYSWNKEDALLIRKEIQEQGLSETLFDSHEIIRKHERMFPVSIPFNDNGDALTDIAIDLGYSPKNDPIDHLPYPTIRLPYAGYEYYYLRVDQNGVSVGHPQWAYAIIGKYIADLWQTELQHPGSYLQLIPSFRNRLLHSPSVSEHAVQISIPKEVQYQHLLERHEKYRALLGEEFALADVQPDERYHVINGYFSFQVPAELWAIYSSNEAATSDGAGYWSDDAGWVPLESATLYSPEQKTNSQLPASVGQDANWVLYDNS